MAWKIDLDRAAVRDLDKLGRQAARFPLLKLSEYSHQVILISLLRR